MTIFNAIFVYLLTWWMVFFCMLPLDIQSIGNRPKDGSMPGAPVKHGIKRKAILATVISFFVWLVIVLVILYGGISFHDEAAKMAM